MQLFIKMLIGSLVLSITAAYFRTPMLLLILAAFCFGYYLSILDKKDENE